MSDVPDLEVHRKRHRQTADAAVIEDILVGGWIAHVGVVRDGLPVVLPFLYAIGDLDDGNGRRLLLHGSTGGGLFQNAGTTGVPVSVTITHIDGLVLARSLNDSSANYRSAMIFARARVVPDALKRAALWIVGDHLLPGRRAEIRDMNAKELAATQVLQVPLDHVSAKVRFAGVLGESPEDGEDHSVWAGVLPVAVRAGDAVPSRGTDASIPESSTVAGVRALLDARAAARAEALRTVSATGVE